ncbi:FecR family protein [uncultured Bacteroides sp.]|uniref:FecR family protein n=1 Tax=uncultured Bacteroides sp. TaxID=162156 RepID=UPI002AAA8250|nr:FecR family protein [uncultured Bacteroides sp.]
MKKNKIIALLEKVSSEKETPLDSEEETQLMKAFSTVPLMDEKLDYNSLASMEKYIFNNINIKPNKKSNKYIFQRITVAAAALLILVFSFDLWIKSMDVKYISINKQLTFILPDQSEATLRNKSSLSYNKFLYYFNRKVQMDGEVYFIVTKGQKFTVETRTHNITVLGTRFTVFDKDSFNVICYEGKVLVERKDKKGKRILIKGQSYTLNKERKKEKKKEKEPNNERIFNNAELVDVLEQIETIYKISFENKEIANSLYFTGAFPTNNLDATLKVALAPYNMTWKQTSSGYKIIKI